MNKKGAALLTVLVALLLMSLMTLELQYTSLVEKKLAYNDLSHLQTHYLAKSGIQLGLLRVVAFGRASKQFGNNKQLKPFLAQLWNLPFPPFPAEAERLERLSLQERGAQEEAQKDTRISSGQFSYIISSESSKINLNFLWAPNVEPYDFRSEPQNIYQFTSATLYNKIEEIFRASESPIDEFGNVRADDIVRNLMDWISPQNVSLGAGNKDAWYEQQDPPYKTKGGPFFTLDEVKRVKDISPALFYKLKPHITVFSQDGKVDLNEATQKRNLKNFFPSLTDYSLKLIDEAFANRAELGGWTSVEDFFTTLKGIDVVSSEQYPQQTRVEFFTVGSQNFLVKGQGVIKKSGSKIQKDIVVSVALDRAPCAEIPNITNPNDCTTKGGFLFANRCLSKPQSLQECRCSVEGLPAAYVANDGGCKLNTTPQVTALSFSPDAPGTPTSALSQPNTVKVYSWVES